MAKLKFKGRKAPVGRSDTKQIGSRATSSVPAVQGEGALDRLMQRDTTKGNQVLATLKKVGDDAKEEARKKAEADKAEAEQRRFEQKVERLIGDVRKELNLKLKVIFNLDYTASTIGDVSHFRSEIETLIGMLKEYFPGGVDFLPIASRGINNYSPDVVYGRINQANFYDSVSNETYAQNRGATPVGAGLIESRHFYGKQSPHTVQAHVMIADVHYDKLSGHDTTIRELRENGVAVASLTNERANTHINALKELEDLMCVIERAGAEMDPVQLIYEFITNLADNKARPIAEERAEIILRAERRGTSTALAVAKKGHVSLSERLQMKGQAEKAGTITEGPKRKQLTG